MVERLDNVRETGTGALPPQEAGVAKLINSDISETDAL